MAVQQAEIRTLKVGRYVVVDDHPCKILSISTSKPGKHGAAKAKVDVVGVFDGNKRTLTGPVTDKCKVPIIDKRKVQVLNIANGQAQLMDMETYENFELPVSAAEEAKLGAGAEVLVMEAMGYQKFYNVADDE